MPLSIHAQSATAEPPLVAAAARGDLPAVSKLLAEGAPVNATDERGRTALMAATHADRPDIVQVLLQAGADVNIRDARSDNPFLYAGAQGQLAILRLAIRAGADPRLTNRFGGTALIPAAERGHVEVVRELLTRSQGGRQSREQPRAGRRCSRRSCCPTADRDTSRSSRCSSRMAPTRTSRTRTA